MNLPRLYKSTKTGATQICDISTDDDKIIVSFGQLDGKMQTKITVALPKNLGRANATTAEEQAKLEAISKHTKKVKSGYSIDLAAPSDIQLPMKVKVYQDQLANVVFPCVSTAKYNGVNGLYKLEDGVLNLYSRGGNLYPPIPHLEPSVLAAMTATGVDELNGELFIGNFHLQDITAAVKKTNENSSKMVFMLFDVVDLSKDYRTRRDLLLDVMALKLPLVRAVVGTVCVNHQEIEDHYNHCMSLGLEGTVVKNFSGLYEYGTRSSNQFKYKKTKDGEYKVVGFDLDKNNHPVYTCVVPEGPTFKVKRKGTNAERLADATIAVSNIGKWLTIEYEVLSKDNVPLKGVGLNFRDCDITGAPLV
jgi:ATP-dependent DNA ligase